jgi:ATP-binding cassette subfamily C protein CydD
LDPRLLRYASAARAALAVGGALAILRTAAVVAFAWLVTQLVVGAIDGKDLRALSGLLLLLAVVVLARGVVGWLSDSAASRTGAVVIAQVRGRLVNAIGRLGPGWLSTRSTADVTLTAGRGLDALEAYFGTYLPQLVLTALATPILVAVIFWQDALSGTIVLVTLPLIPVFMMLVGWATQAAQKQQWGALSTLSRGFLDVVNGLATLKLFGRQHRQERRIRAVSEDYRVHTMRVLRMSFLSGFVLELSASLSVALVAVAVGLRLLNGQLELSVGLFVLLLAPEAFLPLRNVGAGFHAATEGIEAAESAFEIVEAADRLGDDAAHQKLVAARAGGEPLVFDRVTVRYGTRAAVEDFSAVVAPGELTVLSAPSGSGKSTLLAAALGFVPFEGAVTVAGRADAEGRRRAIAWAGQTPGLIAGTVASNVALGAIEPDAALVEEALAQAVAGEVSPSTLLGVGGSGLSGGQAQRVAVARALYRLRASGCGVLMLDEPTSALDEATEARLIASLRTIARSGAAVLVVSHRDAVLEAADRVVDWGAAVRVR